VAAPILEAEALARDLGRGADAFRLRVPRFVLSPGDRVAVVGPSGYGKSTLLSLFALALRPDSAMRFLLHDEDGTAQDLMRLWVSRNDAGLARLRAMRLGFVPQVPALLPFLSIAANIEIAQRLAGRWDPTWTQALVARLGIGKELHRRPEEASVGQRQRASIARALAHRPALLLADEPTAAVHPAQAEEIFRLLAGTADAGIAVLISTHDEARAAEAGFEILRGRPQSGDVAQSVVERPAP